MTRKEWICTDLICNASCQLALLFIPRGAVQRMGNCAEKTKRKDAMGQRRKGNPCPSVGRPLGAAHRWTFHPSWRTTTDGRPRTATRNSPFAIRYFSGQTPMHCCAPRGMKNGTRSDGSALMTAHCSLMTVFSGQVVKCLTCHSWSQRCCTESTSWRKRTRTIQTKASQRMPTASAPSTSLG